MFGPHRSGSASGAGSPDGDPRPRCSGRIGSARKTTNDPQEGRVARSPHRQSPPGHRQPPPAPRVVRRHAGPPRTRPCAVMVGSAFSTSDPHHAVSCRAAVQASYGCSYGHTSLDAERLKIVPRPFGMGARIRCGTAGCRGGVPRTRCRAPVGPCRSIADRSTRARSRPCWARTRIPEAPRRQFGVSRSCSRDQTSLEARCQMGRCAEHFPQVYYERIQPALCNRRAGTSGGSVIAPRRDGPRFVCPAPQQR